MAVNNKSRKNKKNTVFRDRESILQPLPCRLAYEGTRATNRSIAFTIVLLSEDSEMSLTLIHVLLQIRQTYWCLCLTDVWHESL
jgi:hypothetical protein